MRSCKNKPHPAGLNRIHGTRWDESKGCHFERSGEEAACDGCHWQRPKEPKINDPRLNAPQINVRRIEAGIIEAGIIEAGIIDDRDDLDVPINFVEDRRLGTELGRAHPGLTEVECPQCDGSGTIHEGGMSMNPEIDNEITCPRCDGAGEIGGWE